MAKSIKLGNMIAGLTKVLRISHCDKCEQRRVILNEIQKIGLKETVKRMRAIGNIPKNEDLKDVIAKLTDCCKE